MNNSKANERGPIYGVELIESLPLKYGEPTGLRQAMPSRSDLRSVRDYRARIVGGYEVLLNHWREQAKEIAVLQAIVDKPPKCWRLDESGVLRHDVPLIVHEHPKVLVWTRRYPNETDHDRCWLTIKSYANGHLSGVIGGCSRTGFLPSECYVSDEAAEAARSDCPGCGADVEDGLREDGYTRWACGSNTGAWGFGRSQACWERREAARKKVGS